MRKLVVAEFITLDGFIARENGEMDFFSQFQNDQKAMVEAQKNWDCILMGKNTYEIMSHFWPKNKDEKNKVASFMNNTPKVVISSSLKNGIWGEYDPAEIIKTNVVENVKELKSRKGKDIVLMGSAITSQYLLENKLVDEYYLWVYPIIIGKGKSLFGGLKQDRIFAMLEEKLMSKGVINISYKVHY